ncbi:MAG: DNA helicase RecQ [Planctomycetes bacterium]|nr:DNA helicase RecQ [Planctomycetota bacterium]
MSATPGPDPFAKLLPLIDQYWGFRALRPMQEKAMRSVLERRDSLIVLPTGGGKSLCFQAPALMFENETTVVVSPLIALMKDQVDALRAVGYPARFINSSLTETERVETFHELKAGKVRLLYVSPERLMVPVFQEFVRSLGVKTFAIDEAHCISHWGHDFRPEYRMMSTIRQLFPEATFHGYTATATEQVREDIAAQLGLRNPELLVGNFDRPNLCYRVLPRQQMPDQVIEILKRHKGEAGIIYCIRRKDVDELALQLQTLGLKAMPYHAGLSTEQRQAAQEAFRSEKCDLIVATVAFGMGIDRSNVRFVLHAGMPKSVEHYQQEAGRAGRDGLEAECVLLFGLQDRMTWEYILKKSAEEAGVADDFLPNALLHLDEMTHYCRAGSCRHRILVEHFGQEYTTPNCRACDLCLDEIDIEPEGQTIARKILSCVARVNEGFGIGQIVAILVGDDSDKVTKYGHEKLKTYGLLREHNPGQIRDWVNQLLDQAALERTDGDYPILKLNPFSWQIMRDEKQIVLRKTLTRVRTKKSKTEETSWEGIDRDLFEQLREWRKTTAEAHSWPAFTVFGDNTLRELARVRPSNLKSMRQVQGVGDAKLQMYGEDVLQIITGYCAENSVTMDELAGVASHNPAVARVSPSIIAEYYPHFRRGAAIEAVKQATGRSTSTVVKYLLSYIRDERPKSVDIWVPSDVQAMVFQSAKRLGTTLLRPIFEDLGEQVPYDAIRIALAWKG